MKAPFEKFVVLSHSVNEFTVRVAAPESVRAVVGDAKKLEDANAQPELGRIMMERYIFIDDAIREKLERAAGQPEAKSQV
jgi:hypothetical protein